MEIIVLILVPKHDCLGRALFTGNRPRNSYFLDGVKKDNEVNTCCYISPNEGPWWAEKYESSLWAWKLVYVTQCINSFIFFCGK